MKEVGALDELRSQRVTGPMDAEVQSEGLWKEGREEKRGGEGREGGEGGGEGETAQCNRHTDKYRYSD